MLTESQALAAGKGKAAHALDSGCMSFPYLGQTGPVPGPEGMSGTVKASYGLVRKLTDVYRILLCAVLGFNLQHRECGKRLLAPWPGKLRPAARPWCPFLGACQADDVCSTVTVPGIRLERSPQVMCSGPNSLNSCGPRIIDLWTGQGLG